MPQPTMTVTLSVPGLTHDITNRVNSPDPGTPTARWRRGANFDASGAAPGDCTVLVNNQDKAFNPRNSGSTYAGVLKIGATLILYATHTTYQWTVSSSSAADERVTTSAPHGLAVNDRITISGHSGSTPSLNATWTVFSVPTSTTFTLCADRESAQTNITVGGTGGTVVLLIPQFMGRVERIVPRDDGFAEIHAKDALWEMGQQAINLELLQTRTIYDFRYALVYFDGGFAYPDGLGTNTPELDIPITYSYQRTVTEVLDDLNQATGSIHYIKPAVNLLPIYVTKTRSHIMIGASSETWTDADLTIPFAVRLRQFDYTDEGIVNQQRAIPMRTKHLAEQVVWSSDQTNESYPVGTLDPIVEQLESGFLFADPLFDDSTFTGTFTFGIINFGEWVDITVDVVAAGVLEDHALSGEPFTLRIPRVFEASDSSSISTYGKHAGADISDNVFLHTATAAQGLVDYIIWRYAQPRARPAVTLQNRFGTQLLREPGDIITLTSSELSLTSARMIILAFETQITNSGAVWETTYELEELPAAEVTNVYDNAAADYDTTAYS